MMIEVIGIDMHDTQNARASDFVQHALLMPWARWLLASIIAAMLVCLMASSEAVGGGGDDWTISVALSGRYPDSGLCLFINAALSHIMIILNEWMPGINWFLFYERILSFIAFLVLNYGLLTYTSPACACALISATSYFLLPMCVSSSNFTAVTAIAALGGGVLLVGSLRNEGSSRAEPIIGAILIFLASMMRFVALLLCIPFFACALACILWERFSPAATRNLHDDKGYFGGTQWKRVLSVFTPIGITVCLCAFLQIYNATEWQQPEWKEWSEYNEVRSQIEDYPMPQYADVADELEEKGVSAVAYWLATHWVTADNEFFTIDRLHDINSAARGSSQGVFIDRMEGLPSFIAKEWKILLFFIILSCFLLLRVRGARRMLILGTLFLAALACIYFYGAGRLLSRVLYPIILYASTAICLIRGMDVIPIAFGRKRVMKILSRGTICALFLISVYWFSGLVSRFDPGIACEATHQEDYIPQSPILDYIEDYPERVFVWDTYSYSAIVSAYAYRYLPDGDFLLRNICVGGWDTDAPFINARNAEAGMPNVLRGLVENDDAYMLCGEGRMAVSDCILAFIREQYYPDATICVADTVDSESPAGMITVYRFSVG